VRRLLKYIYASVKFPYFVSVTEPWWRSHVNFFFQFTVKEGRFDVVLSRSAFDSGAYRNQ